MTWVRPIARAVLIAASMGGLASLYAAVGAWLGRYQKMGEHPGLFLLFFGIFVVWFPTVVILRQVTRGVMSKDSWKIALRHASPLTRKLVYLAWIYCGAVWAVTMISSIGMKTRTLANEGIYFTAFMLVFYTTAVGVTASVVAMTPEQLDPRCVNGHQVSADAKFCQTCGARVVGVDPGGA